MVKFPVQHTKIAGIGLGELLDNLASTRHILRGHSWNGVAQDVGLDRESQTEYLLNLLGTDFRNESAAPRVRRDEPSGFELGQRLT